MYAWSAWKNGRLASAAHRSLRFASQPRQLGVFVATLCSMAMAAAATVPVTDPDVWWVAAAGRDMLDSGRVPRQNLFSYVEPLHPWIMHEWLLGPVYALGLSHFGPGFFVAIGLGTLAIGLALILSTTLGNTRRPTQGLAVAFVCIACFSGRLLTARPTAVALLLPLVLVRVAFSPRFDFSKLAASVAIVLLWTNVHGSFPLGVALLALAAIDTPIDRPLRLAAAVAAAGVTFVNPYGARLHVFVAGYLTGHDGIYREINAQVGEFQSVIGAYGTAVGPIELVGWALVATAAVAALREQRFRIRGAFVLLLLLGALRQARHIELAGLLGCFLLQPWFDSRFSGLPPHAAPESAWTDRRYRRVTLVLSSLVGVGLFVAETTRRSAGEWIDAGSDFLAALRAVPDGSRLYVPFSRAGLAIWYGAPRGIRVFFDSRIDCYSAPTFTAFRSLSDATSPPAEALAVLASTGTNALIVRPTHPLAGIAARGDFRVAYGDGAYHAYRGGSCVPSPPEPSPPAPDGVTSAAPPAP